MNKLANKYINDVNSYEDLNRISKEYMLDIERDNRGNEYITFADGSQIGLDWASTVWFQAD